MPWWEAGVPGSVKRRSRIPVRSVIHWSLVSTILSRSELARTFSGKDMPVPVMPAEYSVRAVMASFLVQGWANRDARPDPVPYGRRRRGSRTQKPTRLSVDMVWPKDGEVARESPDQGARVTLPETAVPAVVTIR